MNLRMFLLTTGETVVADIIGTSASPDTWNVKAISLQPSPQEQGGLSLTPTPMGGVFGLLAANAQMTLHKSAIVAEAPVTKQIEGIFIQATTGITLAK